jgi:hypothetical protein
MELMDFDAYYSAGRAPRSFYAAFQNPEAIAEMKRILRLHFKFLNLVKQSVCEASWAALAVGSMPSDASFLERHNAHCVDVALPIVAKVMRKPCASPK